jgi:hypothetical protein
VISILEMNTILNLISGPRNVSTALMYSFSQKQDIQVIDEPFYAFYLLKSKKEHPGKSEILANMSGSLDEINLNLDEMSKTSHLFIKNMAHHLNYLPLDWSFGKRNIFLIRNPKYVIASYTNQIDKPLEEDLGYKSSYEILNRLKQNKEKYLIVESKAILLNPEKELSRMCEFAGLDFEKKMLKWEKGALKEDGIWAKHWYKNVHKSTGFSVYDEKTVEIPKRLQPLLEECQYFYELLKAEIK